MADIILTSAATIAREWSSLAIAWHIAAIALVIAIVTRIASVRGVGVALGAPLFSVAALAWWSGNPFNTIVFAIAGALILQAALQLPIARAHPANGRDLGAGVALSVFALVYPHFLDGSPWQYLYAAPLGLLPCPTLTFLIGVSLIVPALASRGWISVLAPLGAIYGVIGVFMLGVTIDWVLLAGAALLSAKRTAASDHGIDHSDWFKHRRTV
ncbi:MAG TPA: hypothetical protein VFV51_11495 [Vicinamibacterales bacterium]|nr:hypothetical protein [Vicinamibacterales bacterium]